MRGWLALIHRSDDMRRQVSAYRELARLFDFFAHRRIIPVDDQVAELFEWLRQQRPRIGTTDLKIAAIAIVHEALLLSANLRDFRRIPNLCVEDWVN